MESSMTTGSYRVDFNWPSLPWTSSSFVGSFSVQKTERLKILTLITSVWTFGVSDQDSRKPPPRSLSARGSSYTTWCVSWKQYSKLFHDSWFEDDGINWWKRRHLYVTKKNTFFCRENQILCGLIVYHAMERLPSAAHSVRFIQNSKFWRKKWCHEILFLGFSMHFKKIIWIDDKPFLQKWWVSQRLSSQLMNTPGNRR